MPIKKLIKKIPSKKKAPGYEQAIGDNCFFIHIPKTAGTSFRKALESQVNVISDYGIKSNETSNLVQNIIYGEQNTNKFYDLFNENFNTWMAGHVPLSKYLNITSTENIVSFVRNPVDQVISHYNHFVKHQGYEKDLSEFIAEPRFTNIQSKLLARIPLECIGVVGLTEHYDDSLSIINKKYSLKISNLNENVNTTRKSTKENIPTELLKRIEELNDKDCLLYQRALNLFKQRVALYRHDKLWTYGYANLDNTNRVVYGVAWIEQSDENVELSLSINGIKELTTKANMIHLQHARVVFPKNGFVAYRFKLPENYKSSDNLIVAVEKTEQQLPVNILN